MTTSPDNLLPELYATPLGPCPYLPDRLERKVFTPLKGRQAGTLFDTLSHAGFRRNQQFAYRPFCPDCQACISVRVRVAEFRPDRSMRRAQRANLDLTSDARPPEATGEQYRLFRRYLQIRHASGEMADMRFVSYRSMVEESPVPTTLIEYRNRARTLLAAGLIDRLRDGLSAVYTFFDPDQVRRSLGTFVILDLIDQARRQSLPYVYLGYWVEGSRAMTYKARFRPLESLTRDCWRVRFPLPGSPDPVGGSSS